MKNKHYSFTTLFRSPISHVSILLLLVLALFNSCEQEDVKIGDATISPMQHLTLSDDILEKVTYGPEQFIRSNQDPTVYEVQLNSEEFTCHQPPYVLTVVNGEPDGTFRVTSARVLLDGKEIFKQSDFKKKVEELEQTIEITSSSVLQVEINGKPGTYVHIYISGEKSVIDDADLKAFYSFSGNVNDESGYDHDGIIIGQLSLTEDRFGTLNSAYHFDGNNNYAEMPFAESIIGHNPDEWTINVWIKPDFIPSKGDWSIFSDYENTTTTHDNRYGSVIGLNHEGYIHGSVRKAHILTDGYAEGYEVRSAIDVFAKTWYMLTLRVSKTNESVELFINGESQGTNPIDGSIDYTEQIHFRVGTSIYKSVPSGSFIGVIDDIRIYDKCISNLTIGELFNEQNCS